MSDESRPRSESLPPLSYGKRKHYLEVLKYERTRLNEVERATSIRRSDVEMYMDILFGIKQSPRPTRVMYSSNMSWKPFQDRLEFLIRAEFVSVVMKGNDVDARSKEALYLTASGIEVLDSWKKAMDMMYEAMERVLKT